MNVILAVFSLLSIWKENRFRWRHHLVHVAIMGLCAVITFLAGYVQKTKSLEKVAPAGIRRPLFA